MQRKEKKEEGRQVNVYKCRADGRQFLYSNWTTTLQKVNIAQNFSWICWQNTHEIFLLEEVMQDELKNIL